MKSKLKCAIYSKKKKTNVKIILFYADEYIKACCLHPINSMFMGAKAHSYHR